MSTHVIKPLLFPHPPLQARRYASLPAPGGMSGRGTGALILGLSLVLILVLGVAAPFLFQAVVTNILSASPVAP
jgi:hypothetical protein